MPGRAAGTPDRDYLIICGYRRVVCISTGFEAQLYSTIVSIRWIASAESISCSASWSSFICCWLVVPSTAAEVNATVACPAFYLLRAITAAGMICYQRSRNGSAAARAL